MITASVKRKITRLQKQAHKEALHQKLVEIREKIISLLQAELSDNIRRNHADNYIHAALFEVILYFHGDPSMKAVMELLEEIINYHHFCSLEQKFGLQFEQDWREKQQTKQQERP